MQTFRQRRKSIDRQKKQIAQHGDARRKLLADARALRDNPRLRGSILAHAAEQVAAAPMAVPTVSGVNEREYWEKPLTEKYKALDHGKLIYTAKPRKPRR